MVRTVLGSEIARVTVVGLDAEILLDEFVMPEGKVEDYLTEFSGVTESLLEEHGRPYAEVWAEFAKIV